MCKQLVTGLLLSLLYFAAPITFAGDDPNCRQCLSNRDACIKSCDIKRQSECASMCQKMASECTTNLSCSVRE